MNKRLLIYFFLLFIGGAALWSCDKEEEDGMAKVIMTFDPRYEGSSIQIADRITNAQGYPVEFTGIQFYISNIELISSGSSQKLSDIEFVSVGANALTMEYEVPSGNYTGIKFDLGVPADMNSPENPDFMISIYEEDHPLSANNGMYWTWAAGYRFFTLEGKCDTMDVGNDPITIPFAFHSGRDTLFRAMETFQHSFNLSKDQSKVIPFEIDMATIFANEGDTIDLKTERQFHGSLTQLDLGNKFADNSAAAIKLID